MAATDASSYHQINDHFSLAGNSNQSSHNATTNNTGNSSRQNKKRMQSFGSSPNIFVAVLRSRVLKIISVLAFSCMFTAVYVNVFQHPPPDMILAMNSGGGSSGSFSSRNFGKSDNTAGLEEEYDIGQTIGKRSVDEDDGVKYADYWEKFSQRNHLVTIGAVYDKCEKQNKQYGIVALMQDKEFGGVKSRTFLNITFEKEIDAGQFNIEVKYNGKDLYDNYWEVCELEDELPPQNRTFTCPVAPGKHSKIKDRHIPGYLPKGRYQTKAWVSDEDEKIIACAFADFTI